MSFLAPLFLAGAAAVALPILFHLIRRSSRERQPFSSLMFLSPTPPRVTRRSRLENVFLLLLRCLILCLLATGFARPFFRKPVAAQPQTKAIKQIILLIDSSASMQRPNLWAETRAKAGDVLKKVSPTDRVAVFTFDRQVRQVLSFEQWSRMSAEERISLATQRIAELKPGWAGTYLGRALTRAAEAFSENKQDENSSLKQIVLITDLQEGSHLEGLQGYEWPHGIEVVVETIKSKKTTNAGLQLVIDRDDSPASTNELGPRIRVSNSSDSKREQFKVRWDGTVENSAVDIYVPPGQSRTAALPAAPAGNPAERLQLSGDEEDFDNSVSFVQAKADEVSVIYLGSEPETDSTQPLYYLKRAFQKTRHQVVQLLARRPDAALSPTEIAAAHLMIATENPSEPTLKTIQQFLSSGKTVLFVMKNADASQTISRLAGVAGVAAEEATGGRYVMFGNIKFEHPLFAPFADPRFSDFTKIHFWKHRRLDTDRIPNARVLARFDDENPAIVEIPVGKGALLVFTSGWHPADSQLAVSTKFVPLIYSILEQSGALKPQRSQFAVGDEVTLSVTNTAAKLTIRKPDGVVVDLPSGVNFTETDLPGIYTVTSAQPPVRFAVNLEASESKTAPLATEELERLGLPIKKERPKITAKLDEQKRQHLQATELENQQRLWRWCILAAFGVLILETWIAGRLTRRAFLTKEA